MAAIRFSDVNKTYPGGHIAVRDLSLEIEDGEFLVLVGPSGCGKSTALRMIAGLEAITRGVLTIGGAVANGLSPRQRNVAMIFQSYALYPHLTVGENLGFALKVRREPRELIETRVGETAAMLELKALLQRRPGQLSGGQRQRVAMGRALVRHPRAFLMDEPLSNLDARLRGQMRVEIARLQRAAGVTTVYVTHDQVEAMTMADRVAVMRDGVLQQLGAPREVYDRPINLFVAGFIGAPPINLLSGALRSTGQGVELKLAGSRIVLPPELIQRRLGLMAYLDREIIVGVRPEAAWAADAPEAALSGVVAFQEDLGATMVTTVELGVAARRDGAIVEDLSESGVPRVSTRMRIVAQSGARRVASQPVRVALDLERLHFFDPVSRLAIV
ncbi:MAG: ATP-binding cassette domain-containing protein [Roseiarcus sp.]|uniref:ABC transporter ATP-binding protein n=1 Tax=Roseiarcus sp. TaxID=1969460 RepID=UPI003C48D787